MNPTRNRLPMGRAVAAALLLLAAASFTHAASSAVPQLDPASAHAERVERGRQLVEVGACNDCHTPGYFYGNPDHDRRLSGSELGWVGPWGTTFPRNLTPDLETGLGGWSEQDIANTLRTGVRPDGSVLKPPMPWQNLAVLSDADLLAIAAYLKSLPAVKHRAPDALPPGVDHSGPVMRFPAPPTWDGAHLANASR